MVGGRQTDKMPGKITPLPDWPWDFEWSLPATSAVEAQPEPPVHSSVFYSPPVNLPASPGEHNWDIWTPDPFDLHHAPFGKLLEPDGYATMCDRQSGTVKAYAKFMPMTMHLATAIFRSLACHDVWGEHRVTKKVAGTAETDEGFRKPKTDISWTTYTAGKSVLIKHGKRAGRKFPMQAMCLLDVIKALASPDHYAVGNKDTGIMPHTLLQQVRIDIDLDYVFERKILDFLQAQVTQAKAVFAAFGLTAEVMRTGNRGIQVLATIPPMPRFMASVVVHALRHVLQGAAPLEWRAEDYQSNLDGLMRLPLGRHAFTGNVAWMLGDDARVLPVGRQASAIHTALCAPSTMNTEWMDEIHELLLSCRYRPEAKLADGILAILAEAIPHNGIVTALEEACQQFDVPFVLRPRVVAVPTIMLDAEQVAPDKDAACAPSRSSIPVDKRRARAIFNAGYKEGESYQYHMIKTADGKRGKNGIGMALILTDGDVEEARQMLHQQAQEMPAESESAVNARISRVNFYLNLDADGLPYNKTYHRLQALLAAQKHKALDGFVMPEETERAVKATAHLAEVRRISRHRVKTFQPKALAIIQHLLELLQMETRCSGDGTARVSYRTLAAEISSRWPDDATNSTDVSRQMEWITPNSKCLFHAVDIAEVPASRFEAIAYTLSARFYSQFQHERF